MKRIVIFSLILLFHQSLIAGGNEEFRATWVITWEHINPGWPAEQNKAQVRKILDNHKKANMNAVLWQARQGGTAYYNSSYEPWGKYAGYQDPGYDPLAYAIEEAHKRGLELHAWINVFETWDTYPGTPAAEHPEWICRDRDGNPMTSHRSVSPGLAEVREYTINVAMEIVRNYDIDGLHLDYVRWNEYSNSKQSQKFAKLVEEQRLLDGMITEAQIQDLIVNQSGRYLYDIEHPYSAGVPEGFESWEDWWRWSVTEFVRVLHDSIQAVKPWVRLSPAALGRYNWGYWQGYGMVYQDAALWFNEGYIDQLTPMHYHWLSASEFYNILAGGSAQSWEPWIQRGINEGRLYTVGPGSYRFAQENVWGRHPSVVNICRTVPWVDGFQFFSYGWWEDYQYWEKAKSLFFNRKTKIRPVILTATPDAPSIALNKIDSLNYEIAVTPPVSISSDQWFAIYRSTDENYDVDDDEIVNIHFGKENYSFIDAFTGTQDYNGQYYYYATVLNRYWNESGLSNVVVSDSIPSFPPTIISTTPAEGDSISINSPIEIHFSKTMDVTSFENAISIIPTVDIAQLTWSDGNKTLTIKMSEYFQYDTEYTLTIKPLAKDINGKPLDGNGDGIGGDPFVLNFKTKAIDDIPPKVVFSYPDYTTETDSFDVRDIFTFVFDELIDPSTLDDNSVALYKSSIKIPVNFLHSTIDDKSLLNVQPEQPLETNTEYTALLWNTITDTSGNPMESYITANFRTSPEHYTDMKMIDDFTVPGDWKQPDYSGSTTGIIVSGTEWGYTNAIYLPATSPHKSAFLRYEWDELDSTFLLREYLAGGPPRAVLFDTTYILQCYIFGDGSNNKFRFCIDESDGSNWIAHEVSNWLTIDWYGWRLVEWQLNDPNSVDQWIGFDGTPLGNGILDGESYRIDSFQLTHEPGNAVTGTIYFDDFRLTKKSTGPVGITEFNTPVPRRFALYQNYPNPFNPVTKIAFDIPEQGLVQLIVYDLLGREVTTLINRRMNAGHFEVQFDGSGLASGTYFYRLTLNRQVITKQMLLMK